MKVRGIIDNNMTGKQEACKDFYRELDDVRADLRNNGQIGAIDAISVRFVSRSRGRGQIRPPRDVELIKLDKGKTVRALNSHGEAAARTKHITTLDELTPKGMTVDDLVAVARKNSQTPKGRKRI